MRNESERARDRRLIVQNLCNGVPLGDVAAAFKRTDKEILDDMKFVVQKVHAYCLGRGRQMLTLDDVGALRLHRMIVLEILERLNLDVLPTYSKITVQTFDRKGLLDLGRTG